ncbi:hypothetical protein NE237_014007 [Protea cynaroides]|uniref:Uncharacterized protein n=1 Tax=Protea cynaroides TaxID=273540 RepID=A0A9Q0H0Z5_9MAGN|nr:hypothetical protein NE237_014007 [Protea cynaroides]
MSYEQRLKAAAGIVLSSDQGVGDESPPFDSAEFGVTASLKPHQVEGVSWLIRRYTLGVNVILGDEVFLSQVTTQPVGVIYFTTNLIHYLLFLCYWLYSVVPNTDLICSCLVAVDLIYCKNLLIKSGFVHQSDLLLIDPLPMLLVHFWKSAACNTDLIYCYLPLAYLNLVTAILFLVLTVALFYFWLGNSKNSIEMLH